MSNQNPFGPPAKPGQRPLGGPETAPHSGSQPQAGPPQQQPDYGQPTPYGQPPYGQPAPYGQQPMQPYPQQPMQPYGQQPMQPSYGQQPMHYAPPGYGPPQMGYGPPPINIVVQNTANAGMGGLVRTGNKSRGTAAVLAIFLGGFGIHKFYLGQPILGILYLFFCWTFFPTMIGFVEGILYLCTSDHAFDMKYNARLA